MSDETMQPMQVTAYERELVMKSREYKKLKEVIRKVTCGEKFVLRSNGKIYKLDSLGGGHGKGSNMVVDRRWVFTLLDESGEPVKDSEPIILKNGSCFDASILFKKVEREDA